MLSPTRLDNPIDPARPPRPIPREARRETPRAAASKADPAPRRAAAEDDGLGEGHPSAAFLTAVPIAFARERGVLGLAGETAGGAMRVAMASPDDAQTRDILRRLLGGALEFVAAEPQRLAAAINNAYGHRRDAAREFVDAFDGPNDLEALTEPQSREDLLNLADRAPVIKLVNLVLFEAVNQQVSDIHIQPYPERIVVRMRIDGVLFDVFELPGGVREEIVSRVKVMARMNIAEKRLPQDGRATVAVGDRMIDLRVSTVPASHGERVVIRLLDKSARLYTLGELGMDAASLERFRRVIGVEHGLVLVTGPTGSGKTTTLYAALGEINSAQRNVITLEDPIEYQLDGVSQIQVSEKKGMTFARGLRSVLRQDPDIIMVGEIRDHETAVMAIQSALTGHLVFSTLHTNDAASAVARLLDLGIEPYLVSSSLVGVLAQRLVRRVCPDCGRAALAGEDAAAGRFAAELEILQREQGLRLRRGAGCDACRQTGYQGRVGIFELLTVDDALRQGIQARATAAEIDAAARRGGMRCLRTDALAKAAAGLTTLDEVVRVASARSLADAP